MSCPACLRDVARRTKAQRQHGGGKAFVPHKCPHGLPCISGHRLVGPMGWNPGGATHARHCSLCSQERAREERERNLNRSDP